MVILTLILLTVVVFILVESKTPRLKIGISLTTIVMLLILAFTRDLDFGTDLIGYNASFMNLSRMSWADAISTFNFNTVNEPFFYYFTKIIADLGFSFSFYLSTILFISLFFTHLIIKRYSKYVGLSYIIYISLGYYFFNLNGIRQSLAIGLVLFSIHYLIDMKIWKFIIVILVASLFHISALVFLILLVIRKIKITNRLVVIAFIMLGLVFALSNEIIEFFLSISFIDKYSYYLNSGVKLNYTNFVIHLLIFLFIYFSIRKKEYDIVSDLITKSLIIGLGFLILSTVVAEFFRFALYFNIISIVAIPIAIDKIKNKKDKTIILTGVLILMITYIYLSSTYLELGWNL